ncbi:hypothetical protein [Staphylococcus devriesei]|uniref:hypothetical protein n=1 Tax=Staphylococcus devriesei TaxID=586733 RepID=UPI001F26F81E|nr:hypothetical protein [Staphylococcus devriesei]MCE5090561.1 hypothetical protein [Staphylococcus devriesei]
MAILWLIIIITVNYLGERLAKGCLKKDKVIKARIITTFIVLSQCVLVYALISSTMPYVVEFLNIFYHH